MMLLRCHALLPRAVIFAISPMMLISLPLRRLMLSELRHAAADDDALLIFAATLTPAYYAAMPHADYFACHCFRR